MPRVLVVAVFVVSTLASGMGAATAAPGLQFLDDRPVVIDLDDLRATQWVVRVFQGQPDGPHALTLHALFEPPGVVKVVRGPTEPVPTGEVATFVIELDEEEPGSGELVVTSSDGAAARRAIRTAHVTAEQRILPGQLRFTGTRLTPLRSTVRADPVDVPSVPSRPASEVGTIVSERGDVAQVVQIGRRFEVRGLSRPGQYEGSADLTPGADGGEVELRATVRDAAGWPLVVLLAGLLAVQALERYQKRVRPRRDLARRLAFLMDRARVAQHRVGGRLRICKAAGADLFLDVAAKDALAAWDRGRVAAEWSAWEVGGSAYQALEKGVDDFRRLTEDFQRLDREREDAIRAVRTTDRAAVRRALDESPAGEALRPENFGTVEEIAVAAARVANGRAHLKRFADLYELLDRLDAPAVDRGTRIQAQQIKRKLLLAGVDLEPLEKQAAALLASWQPAVESPPATVPPAPPAPVVIAGHDTGRAVMPQAPPPPGATPWSTRPRSRWATRTAAGVAALATLAVLIVLASSGKQFTGEAPPTLPGPDAPPLEDAPVAARPSLPPAPVSDGEEGSVLAWGYLAPLLLGGAAALAIGQVVRARRRRPRPPEDFDSRRLDALMREEDRRFALASGLFVVASGMSLLYFPDATFGSAGDYLAVALWGTAVGEGVQLARRLLPGTGG